MKIPFAPKNFRVVNFHGIGVPERELEPGEGDFWVSADRFRSMLDRIVSHPDGMFLSITFDDSNMSDLAIAAPEIQSRGLSAEVYVLTGRVGQRGSLGVDHIRQLFQSGIRIGSHGDGHRDWTKLSAKQLDVELVSSKEKLEEICGAPIQSASIPFGRYNAAVLQALRKAGYNAVYSSDGGCMKPSAFLKPRTSVRRDMSDIAFDRILSGKLPPMRWLSRGAAMALKRWV